MTIFIALVDLDSGNGFPCSLKKGQDLLSAPITILTPPTHGGLALIFTALPESQKVCQKTKVNVNH